MADEDEDLEAVAAMEDMTPEEQLRLRLRLHLLGSQLHPLGSQLHLLVR